jgi:Fe-S cluster assembly ATP-binding protein
MLKIIDLCTSVENKKILEHLNMTINDGEIHALMGPNGTGKSTISKVIMGSSDYQSTGSIKYNEQELLSLNTNEIASQGLFLLNQNPISIEGVTNAEMLRSALNCKNANPVNIFTFNKKLESICEMLDLPKSFIHREINVGMSGGERKKNELMHMWMLEPKFIILDEIDSGLDVDALKICGESLKKYYDEFHPSILIITHHQEILKYLKPNFVHVLKDGKIIATGDASLAQTIESQGFSEISSLSELNENE